MACLLDARARLLVDASLDAYDTSEYALAERLWPKLPPDSLVIVDKGFYSASLLWPLQHRQGRHWLILRVPDSGARWCKRMALAM